MFRYANCYRRRDEENGDAEEALVEGDDGEEGRAACDVVDLRELLLKGSIRIERHFCVDCACVLAERFERVVGGKGRSSCRNGFLSASELKTSETALCSLRGRQKLIARLQTPRYHWRAAPRHARAARASLQRQRRVETISENLSREKSTKGVRSSRLHIYKRCESTRLYLLSSFPFLPSVEAAISVIESFRIVVARGRIE